VKPVSDLDRLWGSLTSPSSVVASSITTDQFNFWMRPHPSGSGFRFAVRQDINHFVAGHVYKDRPKFSSPTEREIIYSKLYHLLYCFSWKRHDPTKNRHPGGLYS
jgi:hypothetical protein